MPLNRDAVSLVLALAGTMVSGPSVGAGSVTRTTVVFLPTRSTNATVDSRFSSTVTSLRTAVSKPE